MADEVPVSDVLCAAMEYLSKLGSNLKVRTDNLKKKKIRKDLLRNTHAVQKAANKVLLICELSKQSLENVETGVKNLLSQIVDSQSSKKSNRRISQHSTDSNIPYEYFEYSSKQLKIRKKISLPHYTSVKVVAKAMPLSMLKDYPVHYDCKLYRLKKKTATPTKLLKDNVNISYGGNGIDDDRDEILDAQRTSDTLKELNNSLAMDVSTSEINKNKAVKINKDPVEVPLKTNINLIDEECVMCEESALKPAEKNIPKKKIYKHIQIFDSSSDSDKEKDNKTENMDGCSSNICVDTSSKDLITDNELSQSNHGNLSDGGKTKDSLESDNTRKTFLKCININKLLQVPEKGNNEKVVLKMKSKQHDDKRKKRCNIIIKPKGMLKDKIVSDNSVDDNFWKQKRKEVQSFKPQEFVININRLPNFTDNFLKNHGLNKITQGPATIFSLENNPNIQKDESNGKMIYSEQSSKESIDGKKEQEIPNSQVLHSVSAKRLVDESNSTTTLIVNEDKDLLEIAENVKKALLNDIDSDRNSDSEINIGSFSDPNTNENENSAQTLKKDNDSRNVAQSYSERITEQDEWSNNESPLTQNDENCILSSINCDSDISTNKDQNSLSHNIENAERNEINTKQNNLSDSVLLSQKINNNKVRDMTSQSDEEPLSIPTTLQDDSIYNVSSTPQNREKETLFHIDTKNHERIESPLFEKDSASSQTPQKRRNSNEHVSSLHSSKKPERKKLSVLVDYSNSALSCSQKSDDKRKDESLQSTEDPEGIKSPLEVCLDSELLIPKKRNKSSKKDTLEHPMEDLERIKCSLLEDSSDSASSITEKRKDNEENVPIAEDTEGTRSPLLEDSSGSGLLTRQEQKDNEDNNQSSQSEDELEKIKFALLKDSLDNGPSITQKIDNDKENDESLYCTEEPERIKSSLADCSDNVFTSQKRKNHSQKDASEHPTEDLERIRHSLLEDSSDSAPSISEKRKDNEEDTLCITEDVEGTKSPLLEDSSVSGLLTRQELKDNEHNNQSSQSEDELEKIKHALLEDSLDSGPSATQQTDNDKENNDSLYCTEEPERIKSSLADCSDSVFTSQKRQKRRQKDASDKKKDLKRIRCSLLEYSSDSASSISEKRKDSNEEDTLCITEDVEETKSPLLEKTPQKRKSSNEEDALIHTTEDVVETKTPLLEKTSQKRMNSNEEDASIHTTEDVEETKSPLLEKTSQKSKNSKEEDVSIHSSEDPDGIKSSLLEITSGSGLTLQKLRDDNKDQSSRSEDEVEKIKYTLLDNSLDKVLLTPQESGKNKETDLLFDNVEKIKSSLVNNSNNSSTFQKRISIDDGAHADVDPESIKSSLLHCSSDTSSTSHEINPEKERDKALIDVDHEKIKQSLLNDYSDSSPLKSQKRKSDCETDSPPKSKRKRLQIMESMHAKKMLLTYSSSSDTDDEQLRNALKEIKEALLKGTTSDEDNRNKKTSQSADSESNSDKDIKLTVKKMFRKSKKSISSTSEDEEINKSCIDAGKKKESSTSSFTKMGRSRAKVGSASSQSSDTQDANDKDIVGLTNLNTLHKSRRRRASSTEDSENTAEPKPPKQDEMPKVPRIKVVNLLKAETSSDAASLADSEEGEEQVEELPTVSLSAFNGDGGHLAKNDLLEDSDSSSSHNENSQEGSKKSDSEEDDNVKSTRRKGPAISSDSEGGSSRRRERARERMRGKTSDFEDSDEGSSGLGHKKRKKKPADSDDNSSVESGKKKRRRIKNVDDSDSDSDTENEGRNKHGRKNIRKVMGKNQLEEATKKAAREEKERIARIAERQKLYNNLEFDESGKPDEVILEKVVLDFDPETKEPLIEVDRGLVKKLKPHQANGIKFMWDACFESVKRMKKDKGSGCILAHCMGLGKTLQVVSLTHTLLTHGDLTGVRRVLVVCPLSTVLNWVNEFRIWLKHAERDYDVDVYELSRYKQNSERAFQMQQWFECGGVCVLGYEMFRNLSADNPKKFKKKMLKNFQESLVDPGPDLVVCDEGHLLKNEKTSLSQSMNRVKTLRRIVLTGTPLQNNLKEYYCMVQFVKPNLLGKYNEYLNRFVNPITNGQYTDSTEHDIRVMKRRSHVLHKMLDGAVQRRDYGVLAPFLPPKHEYVLFITLTEVQIKLYEHYLDNYSRRPLPGKSSGFLFPDFQSLQRIWTHPLVLKYNSVRYENMQQKKRDKEEEDDSEGSLADFIDDESTSEESTSEESSDDYSDGSEDSRKKNKKKKAAKKAKGNKVSTRRGTRANPVEQLEEDEKPLEVLETKYENPTEWWIKLVADDGLDDMRNSHKLVLLFDILRQCEAIGDKLLVFSQSLYSLDLIEEFLKKVDEATQEGRIDEKLGGHVGSWSQGVDYFRLDGSTSCENRSIWCKNFNREDNPRARLFLISTRAGGLGINLVAANRVVIFDVSWNPSHDVQSIFRVYRFGQKKPCYVYRFLAMGTMEEKIYERQVTKQAISKRVIDEQQIDRHYAENDLAELYTFVPRPPNPRPLPPLPRDRLFAELLREHDAQIYKYHEHDSLLENKEEETLSEEERKAAWEDFENEKNRPPPAPFPATWPMANGMMPGLLAQQQQQLAYAALGAMLRKDNVSEARIQEMLPLLYNSSPGMFGGYDYGMMQKMSEIYKYAQPGMMNAGMMNSVMNPGDLVGGASAGALGGASGLQYEPPWLRQQKQQQQMRMQQMMQQQHQSMGAKYYAGGLGSRDPVAMALQQQRAREIMLGERGRPRGRPPLQRAPTTSDVVNLADSD